MPTSRIIFGVIILLHNLEDLDHAKRIRQKTKILACTSFITYFIVQVSNKTLRLYTKRTSEKFQDSSGKNSFKLPTKSFFHFKAQRACSQYPEHPIAPGREEERRDGRGFLFTDLVLNDFLPFPKLDGVINGTCFEDVADF